MTKKQCIQDLKEEKNLSGAYIKQIVFTSKTQENIKDNLLLQDIMVQQTN